MTDGLSESEQTAEADEGELETRTAGLDRRIWIPFAILLTVIFAVGPVIGTDFHLQILFLMLAWGGLATSWNILGGYTGYVSFGHGAFFALGGFTVGLGQQYLNIGQSFGPEWFGLLGMAGLVPMAMAALIAYPFLRLSGGYFAIAMLGFQLALGEAFSAIGVLGGGVGINVSFEGPNFLATNLTIYYTMAAVVLATVLAAYFIRESTFGYGLFAIRENEEAAESIAVPTTRYKVITFVISAFFPGLIGGIYVHHLAFFTAGSLFNLLNTLDMIVYAVVGGLGTVAGPIIGAIGLVFVKNVLLSGVAETHVFFTGLFVVIVMLVFPRGIVGIIKDISEGRLEIRDINIWDRFQ